MAQAQSNQAETLETLMEAWELKKILKIASVADADVVVMPLGTKYGVKIVRFEALSSDRIALVAVDTVGLFNKLNYGVMIGIEDVKKLLKAIPWSRMLVRVIFNGAMIQVHSMDGTVNVNATIVEKPEDIMDGVLRNLSNGVRAVMKVDAFKLLSWFRPFAVVGEGRAHFDIRNTGFTITALNEDAVLRLDVSSALLDYDVNAEFGVSYYLGYVTNFLEEVRRSGSVNVTIAQDKPMLIEVSLESKASVETIARIAQAPMVE